ncbi:rhomboid family intramembrane serine protease [Clostridium malenominatum]|uniref:Rhomboid family intramembrane serine protease n=1 Tax=Clostridium malenominatum TaxID=1539 RepID=A0ABN1J2M1_9CLOT
MDNKNKFINFLLDNFMRGLGYTLQELKIEYVGVVSRWILTKPAGDGSNKVIIMCDEYYDNKNDQWVIDELKNLNIDNVNLVKVFFTDDYNWVNAYIENIDGNKYSYVFLNESVDKILYYTSDNEEIIEVASYYINSESETQKQRVGESRKTNRATMTYIFMAINIIMYGVTALLSGNIIDSNVNVLIFLGAKFNPLISMGQYYRLVTCTFLHGGIVHLGFNMYALNSLGPFVEKVYGKWKYSLIYLISGIVSSTFSYFFSESVSIGASGSIFGLLGACLIVSMRYKDKLGKGFINNIMSVIFVNLIIGFSMANVDNLGHIGGLVGGIILSFVLIKK